MPIIILPPYQVSGVAPGTGNSVLFNGVTDSYEFPYRSEYSLGTGDWTFEGFVQFVALPTARQTLWAFGNGGGSQSPYIWLNYTGSGSNTLSFEEATSSAGTPAQFSAAWTPVIGTWYHVALVRASNVYTMYINGVSIGTKSYTGAQLDSMKLVMGALRYGSQGYQYPMNGLLSNFRLTKSAVYTSTFTPPAVKLTNLANTIVLTAQGDTIGDGSTLSAVATINSSPSVDTRTPFTVQAAPSSTIADQYFDLNKLMINMDLSTINGDGQIANVTYLNHMEGISSGSAPNDFTGSVMTSVAVVSQQAVSRWGQAAQFNGTSAYMTTPNKAGFDFGTGDFTIEAWLYNTSFAQTGSPASNQCIMETRNQANTQEANRYILTVLNTGAVQWTNAANDAVTTSTVLMTLNAWNHVAVTRTGTTLRVFVNGQLGASSTDSQSYAVGTAVSFGALRHPTGSGWTRGFFTGYMDEIRITKGVSRYTAGFAVPLTQFAESATTGLVDAMNTPLSYVGVTYDTAVKKFGTGSIKLTSPGYVGANNIVAAVGNSDFTAEGWFYFTANNIGYQPIFMNTGTADYQGFIVIIETNNTLTSYVSTNGTSWTNGMGSSYVPPINTWIHIALVRNGTTLTLYANGVVLVTSAIGTTAVHQPTVGTFRIGQYPYFPGGARTFTGNIDEFRLTIGQARYTAAFTPPTTRFADSFALNAYDPTFDANTVLVNADTGLVDMMGKTTFSTVTAIRDTVVKRMGTASLGFTGTTSTMLAATTSNALVIGPTWTMEAWVYPTTTTGTRTIMSSRPTASAATVPSACMYLVAGTNYVAIATNVQRTISTVAIPLNTWTHVAFGATAGNVIVYVNGAAAATVANYGTTWTTTGFAIGSHIDGTEPFVGNIDEVRVTNGINRIQQPLPNVKAPLAIASVGSNAIFDPYAKYVIALLRMEGANNGTTFTDDVGNVVTRVGSPVTSTAQAKFGSASGLFNGTNAYLTLPAQASNAYGTGDFTIECWLYPVARSSVSLFITQCGATSSAGINAYLNTSGGVVVGNHNAQYFTTSIAVPLNVWTHVAIVRNGTSLICYVNGVNGGSSTNSTNMTDQVIWIGNGTEGSYWFNGYIDELRLTKGIARYLGGFTPSAAPSPILTANEYALRNPNDAYASKVIMQMGFDGVKATDTTQTNTVASITSVLNVTNSFVEGGSGYFNGSASVVMTDNASYAMGTGDFTIEAWVNMTVRPGAAATIVSLAASNASNLGPILNIQAGGALQFAGWNTAFVTSTLAVPLNQWVHVAVTRQGTIARIFINGVLAGSGTNSLNFTDQKCTVGWAGAGSTQYLTGFLDNVRVTKGVARYMTNFTPEIVAGVPVDPYAASVTNRLRFEGANGATTTVDDMGTAVTLGSGATISTAQSRSGVSSLALNGTRNAIVTLNTPAFGTDDFTVELWAYADTAVTSRYGRVVYDQRPVNTNGAYLIVGISGTDGGATPNLWGVTSQSGQLVTGPALIANTWTHVAVSRVSGVTRLFINGTLIGSAADTTNYIATTGYLATNSFDIVTPSWSGYMDNARITRGIGRYVTSFTPETTYGGSPT